MELVDTKDAKTTQKYAYFFLSTGSNMIIYFRFVCSNYNVGATDTVKRNTCVLKTNLNCPQSSAITTRRTTIKPKTTTRPPFRSGGGK